MTPHCNPLLFVLFLALFARSVTAEVRIWRDQESDIAVSAELVAVEGGNITLKLANGKTFTYPAKRFHEEDQAFAKEWADEHADGTGKAVAEGEMKEVKAASSEIRRALRVEVREESKVGENIRTGEKDTKGKKRTTDTHFNILLSSARGGQELKDISLEYTIYTRSRSQDTGDKSANRTTILKEKDFGKLASLLPGTSNTVKTKSVPTTDSTTPHKKDDKVFEKRLSEEVVGILVDVFVGGAKVTTIEEPAGLMRTVEKDSK